VTVQGTDAAIGSRSTSTSSPLPALVECRVPAGLVVDDLQDLDGAERGAQAAEGCELVGVDLWHAAHDAGCGC
jgi:hypothetical protein